MGKYTGTHSCGHSGEINVCGPQKNRQWQVDRFFNENCPKCKKIQLLNQNDKNIQKSEEMNLQKLNGSEKQNGWASTIRLDFIQSVEKFLDSVTLETNKNRIKKVIDYVVKNKISSNFWIDNRKLSQNFGYTKLQELSEIISKEIDIKEILEN